MHMYIRTCKHNFLLFFRVKWFCHFDDDVYVNVKELSKLLSQYNSSEPYYIGRNARGPYGVKVRSHVTQAVSISSKYETFEVRKYCKTISFEKENFGKY